ncbi:MAG: pstC [Actinomycetia bacterium]|nr:pstC [Actinomycetes bacterium]
MVTALADAPVDRPSERRDLHDTPTTGDRVFRSVVTAAAWSVLLLLGLIALFLGIQAWPALHDAGGSFFTVFEWDPDGTGHFGIAALVAGTVIIALIALVVAMPVSIGTALFINEYAPAKARRALTTLIDLLAAIPSLIFGMWGVMYLSPKLDGTTLWLSEHLGFIPIFHTSRAVFGSSMFVCGLVVTLMIVPIITSVTREVISQAPRATCEAALALGGSRWGMIRRVLLPYGRSGIVGASMLGLGRAMGETIAIALILSFNYDITPHILEPGGGSIAGLIANNFGESGDAGRHALVAAGLTLFVLTLGVNMVARFVVRKSAPSRQVVL